MAIPDEFDQRFDFPPEARATDGGGDPKPTTYWAVWNRCAPENRAHVADANGGPDAGWWLVDDVLADPGIQLGDHLIGVCAEAVTILEVGYSGGDGSSDPTQGLAAQLLAAEPNLSVGSETCPAAEESVLGAHILLAAAGFDGTVASPLDDEAERAVPQLIDLLTVYNSGQLCR